MNWAEIERSVLDCTVTSLRSSLVENVPSTSTRNLSSESVVGLAAPESSTFLDALSRESPHTCRCEDIGRLEQRLLSCEEDCKEMQYFKHRLRELEEDTKKNSVLLGHVHREIGDLVDKIGHTARRTRELEDRVDEKLSDFVSKRSFADSNQDSVLDINMLKKCVIDNKMSSENLLWLLCAVVDANGELTTHDNLSSFWNGGHENVVCALRKCLRSAVVAESNIVIGNHLSQVRQQTECKPSIRHDDIARSSAISDLEDRMAVIERDAGDHAARLNVVEVTIQDLAESKNVILCRVDEISKSTNADMDSYIRTVESDLSRSCHVQIKSAELRALSTAADVDSLKRQCASLQKGLEVLQEHLLEVQDFAQNNITVATSPSSADIIQLRRGTEQFYGKVNKENTVSRHSITSMFRNRLYNSSGQEADLDMANNTRYTMRNSQLKNEDGNVARHTNTSTLSPSMKSPTTSSGSLYNPAVGVSAVPPMGYDSVFNDRSEELSTSGVVGHVNRSLHQKSDLIARCAPSGIPEAKVQCESIVTEESSDAETFFKAVTVPSANIPMVKHKNTRHPITRATSWHEDSTQCTFCLRRIQKCDAKQHAAVCELRTESCRYGCRARVLAIKMEKHVLNCPNNPGAVVSDPAVPSSS